jgi:hypothetical protein
MRRSNRAGHVCQVRVFANVGLFVFQSYGPLCVGGSHMTIL